ncbi:hypothetical protein DFH29DRAFT_1004526 [Suillus ampliporus]|nr:hypothetical protein DFH29DRAFT_1004526 [Suillus ampliporus]
MAQHHTDSSSGSDELLSSSEESTVSSVDHLSSLGSRKGLAKPKKIEKMTMKKSNKATNDKKGPGPIRHGREECMHVTRWIPRGIDMFVILKDTFRIARNKLETELNSILYEMQEIIGQIHSEDASHLKPFIGNYAVAQPRVKGLKPPIFSENKKSCARMGVNHSQLAGMLCLVKQVNAYHADPKKVQEQLQNGEIRMSMGAWPALAYPGDPPGIDFDIEDIQEGFLKGHILKRVLRHIYTSPSSTLIDDGELTVTRSGNVKLHSMYKVEAEHIAYAFVQSCFGISSCDKWQETDGNYSYCDAYYCTIKAIRELFNEVWAEELLEWWNKAVFSNKRGVPFV